MADDPKLLREFLLGFMRVHVLHHAAEQPIYGLWMRDELASHGYNLSVGTLYPMLHQLEEAGYLTSEQRVVGGRTRRYYTATAAGSALLAELRPKIRELVDEVAPQPADKQAVAGR
jgi:PadR family transcriptional regulator, regulatory protein PadR